MNTKWIKNLCRSICDPTAVDLLDLHGASLQWVLLHPTQSLWKQPVGMCLRSQSARQSRNGTESHTVSLSFCRWISKNKHHTLSYWPWPYLAWNTNRIDIPQFHQDEDVHYFGYISLPVSDLLYLFQHLLSSILPWQDLCDWNEIWLWLTMFIHTFHKTDRVLQIGSLVPLTVSQIISLEKI